MDSLPISPHPPGELITPSFGLHKNNGLVLLFTHDLLQQTDQSYREQTKEKVYSLFIYWLNKVLY